VLAQRGGAVKGGNFDFSTSGVYVFMKDQVNALVQGNYAFPKELLGIHPASDGKGQVIRGFFPHAKTLTVINKSTGNKAAATKIHADGLFEASISDSADFSYRFELSSFDDHVWETDDPYRFESQVSDFDAYLIAEGTNYRTYKSMGAHLKTVDGVEGVLFTLWAPNATRVSIIGSFNKWDGRQNPMQNLGSSGIWELFIPSLCQGDLYKFEIKGLHGYLTEKADPYAFASEMRPRTASMVWDINKYSWNDAAWMKARPETNWHKSPISIYEVHLGSWQRIEEDGEERFLTYEELGDRLIPYVKELGYTHIELLPITEHPFDGSWGYQCLGYFSPTSRFGDPDAFKRFVDRCHQENIGVILDWVPAHFPKDEHGLAHFDGSHLYEHSDPRKGEHSDWGTLIYNYGRNEVKAFLLSSAIYWADIFHLDGIRVDAVASMLYLDYSREEGEWLPNEYGGRENLEAVAFLKQFNEVVHLDYPGFLTFAEESTSWPGVSQPTFNGGLGFDFKWNMGWMHDTLEFYAKETIHRKHHHGDITFPMVYAYSENFILPYSHDEVVHGKGSILNKMPGDDWQKFANARLAYAFMWSQPGKKLLFMGCEFGQWDEWDADQSMDWHLEGFGPHKGMRKLITDLNKTYVAEPALYENDYNWEGFRWIDLHDAEQSVLSYIRLADDQNDFIICVFNFTQVPRNGYRLGVPQAGEYSEVLNTDSEYYGGSNVGSHGERYSEEVAWQDNDQSISINLPPLSAVFLKKTD